MKTDSQTTESYAAYISRTGHERKCLSCDGTGEHVIWTSNQFKPVIEIKCSACDGRGRVKVSEDNHA